LHDFIYGNFKLSLKYLREIKNYFWFVLFLFFGIGILGYFFPVFFEEWVLNLIKEIMQETEGLDALGLIRYIFINNFQSSFFAMLFGIFFGIIPFMVLVVNGYFLGFVANGVVDSEGLLVLWRLLPHGVFELPAVFISIAIGLRLGVFLIVYRGENKLKEFRKWLIDALRVFVFVVVPLLVIAAVIEGWLIWVFG